MKIRTGFVSNSSSASFVIEWQAKIEGNNNLDWVLCQLFDIWVERTDYLNDFVMPPRSEKSLKKEKEQNDHWNNVMKKWLGEDKKDEIIYSPSDEEDIEESWYNQDDYVDSMHYLKSITSSLGDGKYRTNFFTSMLNGFRDFGTSFSDLVTAVAVQNGKSGNRDFEITRMEMDDRD